MTKTYEIHYAASSGSWVVFSVETDARIGTYLNYRHAFVTIEDAQAYVASL